MEVINLDENYHNRVIVSIAKITDFNSKESRVGDQDRGLNEKRSGRVFIYNY